MTNRLPAPVTTVAIPEMLSPSTLALAAECPLRAVLSAAPGHHPRLPIHPAAKRGALFHTLLERAAKGAINRTNGERPAVEHELRRLLDVAEASLQADPSTAHFARLDMTLSAVEWHNVTRDVLASAQELLAAAPEYEAGRERGAALRFSELPEFGRFAEVRIDAPALRLSGRMDVVERQTLGTITIRDYKTGKVRERDGSVLPRIALQLRLYALAIKSIAPTVRVDLFAMEGTPVPIAATDDVIAETRDWLQNILHLLPPGATIDTRSLANPGPQCAFCAFRHVCPRYLDEAPGLWLTGVEAAPMPYDSWGEITEAKFEGDFSMVDIVDAAGRKVKITRLSARHGNSTDFVRGQRLYLFGLVTHRTNIIGGRYFHPRNFFELPVDVTQRRAWSLAVFTQNELDGNE